MWRSAVGCLERWCPPARALLLKWRTHLHPRGVVWAWPPAGAKLVGGTGQGRSTGVYLASKAFVHKEPGGGVCHVLLPPDPLPLVHTSPAYGLPAGAKTIPLQITLERSKFDNLLTSLLLTSSTWKSRDAGSGDQLARWKTGLPEPILFEWHSVGTKGESQLSLPEVQPQKPKVIVDLGIKHRLPVSAIWPSMIFLGSVNFLGFQRNCIGS